MHVAETLDWWKLSDQYTAAWQAALTAPYPELPRFLDGIAFESITNAVEAIVGLSALDIELRYQRHFDCPTSSPPPAIYRVEDYLRSSPVPIGITGALELIAVEARQRFNRGALIAVSEYWQRFPHYPPQAIEGALREYTRDARPQLDDYEWEGKLGEGGMGSVHLYRCRKSQRLIALKTGRPDAELANALLVKEAEKLLELAHPNLISIHDLYANAPRPYYTMEYIPGTLFEFDTWSELARNGFVQLADVLHYLHTKRIIHCDVKPENLLVTESGKVVLLDLGIAVAAKVGTEHDLKSGNFRGTLRFMSPEQLRQEAVGASSDWYAFGVMLFKALTGQWPFHAHTFSAILEEKQNPPAPHDLSLHVPRELNDLCHQLLSPHKEARPAYCDIVQTLGASRPVGIPASRTWVGRDTAIATLSAAYQQAFPGPFEAHPVIVEVRGHSGIGKSALIERFIHDCKSRHRAFVLSGKCYASGVHGAFGGFNSLIPDLVEKLSHRCRDEPQRLRGFIPLDAGALLALDLFGELGKLVELAGLHESSKRLPADPLARKQMAFSAFRDHLRLIAREYRLIIFLDDLQWAGKESAELFNAVFQGTNPPACLVIYAFRDDGPAGDCVRLIQQATRDHAAPSMCLALDQLPTNDMLALLRARLSAAGKQYSNGDIEILAQHAQGNPFRAETIVKEVLESTDSPNLNDFDFQTVLQRQLDRLPSAERRVIELLAVAGRPIPGTVVADVCGLAAPASDTLRKLQHDGFIKFDSQGRIDAHHDQIRESAIQRLQDHQQHFAQLSRQLAEYLQGLDEFREHPDWLAQLYEQANDEMLAGEYHERAAEREAGLLRFNLAAQHQSRAIYFLKPAGRAQAAALVRYGDYLALSGEAYLSAKAYREAADLQDSDRRVDCLCEAAKRFLNGGYIREGRDALREVYVECRMQLPRSTATQALALRSKLKIVTQRAWISARGLNVRQAPHAVNAPDVDRILNALWAGVAGLSVIEPLAAAELQLRYLRRALQAGEPRHAIRAAVAHVLFLAATDGGGSQAAVDRLLRQVETIAQQSSHVVTASYATGLLLFGRGIAAHLQGRWEAAVRDCERAALTLRTEEDASWEINAAQSFSMWAHLWAGRVAEAATLQPARYELAAQRKDVFAQLNFGTWVNSFISLAKNEARAAREALDKEEKLLPDSGFYVQHHNYLLARTQLELYEDNAPAAWRVVEHVWGNYRRGQLDRVEQVRVAFWASYGTAALGAAAAAGCPRSLQRAVHRAISTLRRENVTWSKAIASFLQGGFELLQGRYGAATSNLAGASHLFRSTAMRLHAAVADGVLADIAGRTRDGADGEMRQLGIIAPQRMAQTLFPIHLQRR